MAEFEIMAGTAIAEVLFFDGSFLGFLVKHKRYTACDLEVR